MDYSRELIKFRSYLEMRVQPSTAGVYTYALKCFFGKLDGHEATEKYAQEYIDSLAATRSASTAALRAHAIMRWFKWHGKHIDLDCPTIRMGEPQYLTMPQFEKLLAACTNTLVKTLVIVLFDTAVRISELLNIELDDINWEQSLITVVRKGGRKQDVNIFEKGLAALSEWIESRNSKSKKVFEGIDYWETWNQIKVAGRRAGIDNMHPHLLRHTRAIHMLMNGATLHDVQMHLGHASIATTTDIYGRYKAIDLKERIPQW